MDNSLLILNYDDDWSKNKTWSNSNAEKGNSYYVPLKNKTSWI